MNNNHFDYVIIGNGMAGLQLAFAFANDSFFDSKTIALIDKDKKETNDKTWSFWEKGSGKWESLIHKSWDKASFNTIKKLTDINLGDYNYKTIKSLDFYNYIKEFLSNKQNFNFIIDEVIDVADNKSTSIKTTNTTYTANHVFDSRIPAEYFDKKDNYTKINQHFKGWIIETEFDAFNPECFTMMDYRLKYENDTSFTYVLPFSKRKALIEFTFFTPYVIGDTEYDTFLKKYIEDVLGISHYSISEIESGNIPMTDFPFHNYHSKNITKIGTAGGWVKGSTGYAFKHTEGKVTQIIKNIKQSESPSKGLVNKKYLFYDKIFLDVLNKENQKGEWIFDKFYNKNSIENMFAFLDERSNIYQDISIMLSLFSKSFIRAFFRTFKNKKA